MITSETVELACAEVGQYTEETMAREFERFFREQPDVCDFVAGITDQSSPTIRELSLFLSFMVFKAAEIGESHTPAPVTAETIDSVYRESETWIERISQAGPAELQAAVAASFQTDTEPHLLHYVISELNELHDGKELDDNAKGEVFFVLKTVISSLASATKAE